MGYLKIPRKWQARGLGNTLEQVSFKWRCEESVGVSQAKEREGSREKILETQNNIQEGLQ